MPSLKALKQRIHSVTSTRKITSAMKMVATSYYRRYQERLSPLRALHQNLSECIKLTLPELPLEVSVPALVKGRTNPQNHLLIALGSSRGLCGSFNARILAYIQSAIQTNTSKGQTVSLLCLGPRLFSATHTLTGLKKTWSCPIDYKNIETQAAVLAIYLQKLFDQTTYDACTLLYAQHDSALSFTPKSVQLFPFSEEETPDEKENTPPVFGVEPGPEELLLSLMKQKIETGLLMGLMESKASEESTRMVAMENATKNADDMIRQLNIDYNRTRQAYITRELIEIISGAEAL